MQRTVVKSRTYGKGGYYRALKVSASRTGGVNFRMYGTNEKGGYDWSYNLGGSKAKKAKQAVSTAQARLLYGEISSLLHGGEYVRPVRLGGRSFWPHRAAKKYGDRLYGLYLQDGKSVRSAFLDRVQMEDLLQALNDYVVVQVVQKAVKDS